MNYFPNNNQEISLVKFIAKFQYLSVNDTKYFFSTQKYYRARITNLVKKKYLRRIKSTLVLDEIGIEYCKLFNFEYTMLNRNQKYLPRLLCISNLGAYYNSSKSIKFTPSFAIKDKEIFTMTARKFIGVLDISGVEYLVYYISSNRDNKYIKSVIYDIEKERKYKNIIVFVNDIKRININDFAFGYNQVLIIEDTELNRELLKTLHSIEWLKIVQKLYKTKIFLSEYKFCDYCDYKNKYISYFYFLDSEKINRLKYFLRENKNKSAYIICPSNLKELIQKELPSAIFSCIDLEEFIDKERNIYD